MIGTTETLIFVLIVIPLEFIWGLFTMKLFERKGKSRRVGFVLGFLLGILGVIIALFIPGENTRSIEESTTAGTLYLNSPLYVAGVGALLTIIGSFLPWVSVTTVFGTISINGIDHDGKYTLVFGILSGLGVLQATRSPGKRAWGAAFFSLLTLAVGTIDLLDASARLTEASSDYAVGSVSIGLYLVVFGGFFGLASFRRIPNAPKNRSPKPVRNVQKPSRRQRGFAVIVGINSYRPNQPLCPHRFRLPVL